MNIFLKQIRRKPVFTVFVTILLCFALSFAAIGFSACSGIREQIETVRSGYTTIAVKKSPDISGLKGDDVVEELRKHTFALMEARSAPDTENSVAVYLSAYIPESVSLSSSRIDPSELNQEHIDNDRYSICVFAVECKNVEEDESGANIYTADFSVEKVISLSSAYDWYPKIEELGVTWNVYNEDGSVPVKPGSKYLLFGTYAEYRTFPTMSFFENSEKFYVGEGYTQSIEYKRSVLPATFLRTRDIENDVLMLEGMKNGDIYYYSAPGTLPWIEEYTGNVEDFLESEEGKIWREEIIPLCEMNHHSATVFLTDNINSVYAFNTGSSFIIEGRNFYEDDYKKGKKLCLISADYAEINSLEIGDKIKMELFDTGITEFADGARMNSVLSVSNLGSYKNRNYINPKDSIDFCEEFEIIGIYSTPRFSFGISSFDADQIVIPKNSVPNAEKYYCVDSGFVLENGTIDEFETYMAEKGYPEMFIYNDQGYSAMEETLLALEANAKRMMTLGMSVFALITALFLFLNFRRMMPVIRGVRLLGKTAGRTRNEVFAVLFMEETLSVIIGTVLAAVLYNSVTSAMLSEAIALDFKNLLSAAAALLGILGILSFMLSGILSNVKLMKRK
ncbi:MAG: hypothetical protein IJE28_07245 [Oscillospiraceae bacterium]|nr:hypothetical protein [Oscillospiraceae bacterium]MBQ3501757.1 hypothetical protein [Oscillospiraceae bacterium]